MCNRMRALVMTGYGGPDKTRLRDMGIPDVRPGGLLVKVRAAGLNPVDFKIRDGMLKAIQDYSFPAVMGNELAGTVEVVGDGVLGFKPGDRIYARVPKEDMGAIADYAAVPADVCAIMPASLDFAQAAAVPLAGLTALQVLRDKLKLQAGNTVFISAGAGGVGTFAIPIAKWLGAHVTTTASPRGLELVARLGADRIIDYTSQNFEDLLTEKVDGAFDLVGGETLTRTFGIVKSGGKVVSIAGMPEPRTASKDLDRGFPLSALFWVASLEFRLQAKRHGVDYRYLFMRPSGHGLRDLACLVDDELLKPVIDHVFPFAESKEALAYLERGHAKGKVIISMED